jgi:hypothetical protein
MGLLVVEFMLCLIALSFGLALIWLAWDIWRAPAPRPEDYKSCLRYNRKLNRMELGKKLRDSFVDSIGRWP